MAQRSTPAHSSPASLQPKAGLGQRLGNDAAVAGDPFGSPLARLAPMVAMFAAVMLTFWPALDGQFINWDDPGTITSNPNFRGLTLDHVRWMFTTGWMGHYQPLAWLSFSLDFELWQMRASGYHLTNVILHALNAALVYVVTMQILNVTEV